MIATNIGFINADGIEDETQFDTTNEKELYELMFHFLEENGVITYKEKVIIND